MQYRVHVSQFEGPLDLLLHLIESAELDIKDIFVSEITNQYLSYMQQLDALDMDTTSEFLAVAATLLYIKSRQLLPRPPKEDMEPEEDPEVLLIRQLREYKLFKQAGECLRALRETAAGSYARLPEEYALPDQEVELSGATLELLYQSFFTLLHASPQPHEPHPLHQVRQDAFTVRMQIGKIRALLRENGRVRFEKLFEDGAARLEILVTFMAILEMAARGEIQLKQNKPFAHIHIYAKEIHEDDAQENYMDEAME